MLLVKAVHFLYIQIKGFDAERLRSQFIGERTAEGYGELIATPAEASADVCIYKTADATPKKRENIRNQLIVGEETGRILQQLLQNEFARQMEEAVRIRLKTALEENQNLFIEKGENPGEYIW